MKAHGTKATQVHTHTHGTKATQVHEQRRPDVLPSRGVRVHSSKLLVFTNNTIKSESENGGQASPGPRVEKSFILLLCSSQEKEIQNEKYMNASQKYYYHMHGMELAARTPNGNKHARREPKHSTHTAHPGQMPLLFSLFSSH